MELSTMVIRIKGTIEKTAKFESTLFNSQRNVWNPTDDSLTFIGIRKVTVQGTYELGDNQYIAEYLVELEDGYNAYNVFISDIITREVKGEKKLIYNSLSLENTKDFYSSIELEVISLTRNPVDRYYRTDWIYYKGHGRRFEHGFNPIEERTLLEYTLNELLLWDVVQGKFELSEEEKVLITKDLRDRIKNEEIVPVNLMTGLPSWLGATSLFYTETFQPKWEHIKNN